MSDWAMINDTGFHFGFYGWRRRQETLDILYPILERGRTNVTFDGV